MQNTRSLRASIADISLIQPPKVNIVRKTNALKNYH